MPAGSLLGRLATRPLAAEGRKYYVGFTIRRLVLFWITSNDP